MHVHQLINLQKDTGLMKSLTRVQYRQTEITKDPTGNVWGKTT